MRVFWVPHTENPILISNSIVSNIFYPLLLLKTMASNRDKTEILQNLGKLFFRFSSESSGQTTLKNRKMRVHLHRVTWLWLIKNRKSKISIRLQNGENVIKIIFTYHQWILHKISQLSTALEFRNFISF